MRRNLPDINFFKGKIVPGFTSYKIIELIDSGNNAHVFKAYSDELKNNIAVKIIPKANLIIGDDPQNPLWKQEILKANSLSSPAVVKFMHLAEWVDVENNIDCAVLCSEFIKGKNLERFLKDNKRDLSINLVEIYLKEMLAFVFEAEKLSINHGDLHSKNILVEDRSEQLTEQKFVFRITDFGVTNATSGQDNSKDDYEQIAVVLREILKNIDYQILAPRDRFVYNYLNNYFLPGHLIEKDTTRDPIARQSLKLYEKLTTINAEFQKAYLSVSQEKLLTPFDYLSCEQLGEAHSLLKALYSDNFLGLGEIESRNNIVLTGPRGCGKTTVYKSSSLKHRILINEDDPSKINYIGIYYRCDDLYSNFPRYQIPAKEEAYDIPIHFFISTLISLVLDSLKSWSEKYFADEFKTKEPEISKIIWETLGLTKPQEPGVDTFNSISFRMQKERLRAARKNRFFLTDSSIGDYFNPAMLVAVCENLIRAFSFLQSRPFYFFIDDYSIPKVTDDLQRNINRLLMQRNASCFFKLSTESPVSFVLSDIDGKNYVESREFKLLNLGLVYLSAEVPEKLKFIEDIFKRRFSTVSNYPVSNLDELLGNYSGLNQVEIARALRKKEKPEIWGKENLVQLCSGDIFYIISLVGRMVSYVSSNQDDLSAISDKPKIALAVQMKAIRDEAGNFLNGLRVVPNGSHLVRVVTSFANVAHSYLMFRNSGNLRNNPPHQASRIEPFEELKLSEKAYAIYQELLRYSIFIEDPRGKSRRGKIVPRLYLRRSLLPHFNLTFSKRDSIELENEDIEFLLLKPNEFEDKFRLTKETEMESPDQIRMFPDERAGLDGISKKSR
jgi:serine/threonine protein kinase